MRQTKDTVNIFIPVPHPSTAHPPVEMPLTATLSRNPLSGYGWLCVSPNVIGCAQM